MAISKSLKGVSVSITINGTKCTEYEAPADETQHEYPKKTVLRYIEAISGTNYSILNEVSSAYKLKSSLEFVIQVDAWTLPANPLFTRQKYDGAWNRTIDGKEQVDHKGKKWKKPFKFSPLNIVDVHDRDRIKRDANASKHIGEIKVTVIRRQARDEVCHESRGVYGNPNLEIAEKAVKGQTLSHGTEQFYPQNGQGLFMRSLKGDAVIRRRYSFFDTDQETEEALEADHIIPRAKSPDILQGFSEEEIRRIARESLSGSKPEDAIIKKEAGVDTGTWRKFTNDDEILTIDITGDGEVEVREPKAPIERVDLGDD